MKVYISCGAGDFIAIESFLVDSMKKQITEFYLFTRAAETIKQLISFHPYWRGLPVHIPLTEKQILDYGVYSFFDKNHLKRKTHLLWPMLDDVQDFSGELLYPEILKGNVKYKESLFEIDKIDCDIVLDAESNNDPRMTKNGRNLTIEEITKIIEDNDKKIITQVGLGKTDLKTALGFVKGCKEFYGVDSMLACYAARQPGIEKIVVKTINPIYIKWLPIYDPMQKITVIEKRNGSAYQ